MHFPVYNPFTGNCRSYLISMRRQEVCIGEEHCVTLEQHEPVFMEISRKYTVAQMNACASTSGFRPLELFQDSRKWFADAVWECV